MPTRSYAEVVRIRESNDYEELSRTKMLYTDGAVMILEDAAKEQKFRKRGLVPVGEEEGFEERVRLEKAMEPVRRERGMADDDGGLVPNDPLSRMRRLSMAQLRQMVRDEGITLAGTVRKDDLITVLLQRGHDGIPSAPQPVQASGYERVVDVS
jgi:hypothetical protein